MDYTGKTHAEVRDYIRSLPVEDQGREWSRFRLAEMAAERVGLEAQVRARLDQPTPERVAEILKRGNLPKRTLPGLRGLESLPANAAGLVAAREYYAEWSAGKHPGSGRGFYFYGSPGTGKTTLLASLAFDLLHRGGQHSLPSPQWTGGALVNDFKRPSVQFWKLGVLLEKLKPKRGRQDEDEDEFSIEKIQECDVLILDDLGKVRPTDWNMLTLFSVLDVRDSELRPTWYSSNYSLDDLAARYIDALGKKYEPDVDALIDRIAGNCEQVEFSGPSWRVG